MWVKSPVMQKYYNESENSWPKVRKEQGTDIQMSKRLNKGVKVRNGVKSWQSLASVRWDLDPRPVARHFVHSQDRCSCGNIESIGAHRIE